MPPLHGFSDNPFLTRADLLNAVYALLTPLSPYQSPQGARIRLPVATAAHFDEVAAQLEGFARPLWAIGALLASQGPNAPIDKRLSGWIRGFDAGCDPAPENEEYWGDVADKDQRMVEVEILAYALLSGSTAFLGPENSVIEQDVKRRGNITRYLQSVNGKEFPQTNWLWFRVMGNLALVKACGVPYAELKESMNADLKILDSFYLGDGWASDGAWNEGGRQMDYYSGSFAIQFSQLMYVHYARDLDPERCEVYKQRAREFAVEFWGYFNDEGAAIPFGRSLTYRFAMAGFWAAVTMTGVDLPAPMTPGVVKGLLLRNLRYWGSKHDIFYPDGTMNIGFHYPNMYMSEDYNSPQSPYWCMKTFCFLALPAEHPFWSVEEEPLPVKDNKLMVKVLKNPRHILVDSSNHHFLLSAGQFCGWPLKATHAKYSKFAYSSSFGFSVPTGPLIQQLAPDSTLALSEDGGETWRMRWKSEETTFASANLMIDGSPKETLPVLSTKWKAMRGVEVQTTLIPPSSRWPDWHIRVHEITVSEGFQDSLDLCEGGFAIFGQSVSSTEPRSLVLNPLDPAHSEGILEDNTSALVMSSAGASGVCSLGTLTPLGKGSVLKPDSNTNLMEQRTLIPTMRETVSMPDSRRISFITGVFAISGNNISRETWKRWEDKPVVNSQSAHAGGDFIAFG